MKNVDVYKQYFSAECTYAGVRRQGAVVWLNAESDSGTIRYEVGVTFFPHRDPEDFAISYDACATKELIRTQGRRSKKRDAQCMEQLRAAAEEIAATYRGAIRWDKPLTEAEYG
jgi:hypothetical protein